jgi:hypothetical protein
MLAIHSIAMSNAQTSRGLNGVGPGIQAVPSDGWRVACTQEHPRWMLRHHSPLTAWRRALLFLIIVNNAGSPLTSREPCSADGGSSRLSSQGTWDDGMIDRRKQYFDMGVTG